MKSDMKSFFKYFLKVVASAYLGLLVLIVLLTPLRFSHNEIIIAVGSSGIYVGASVVCLFFLCKREGYHDNNGVAKMQSKRSLILMVISVATYDLLTIIFQYYHPAAASSVTPLAKLIGNIDTKTEVLDMASDHTGLMLVSLLFLTVPFIPAMIWGYQSGWKKRKLERESLTQKNES